MLLSDRDITAALESGRVVLDPYDPGMVQPSSVDVRLDRWFRLFDNHRYSVIDPAVDQDRLGGDSGPLSGCDRGGDVDSPVQTALGVVGAVAAGTDRVVAPFHTDAGVSGGGRGGGSRRSGDGADGE